MRKFLFVLCLIALITGCNNKNQQKATEIKENPAEQVAIENIKFFSHEIQFDSISNVFYSKVENPKWNDDMIAFYPYIYNGFGFHRIKGIYSEDDLLIGVVLSGMDNGHREVLLPDNMKALEKAITEEYGNYVEAHQTPSEKDVREKGEYTFKLWKQGNKYALMTLSAKEDSENIYVNLYIYRKDKINSQQSDKNIDEDITRLKSLM